MLSDQPNDGIPGLVVMNVSPANNAQIIKVCNAVEKAYRKNVGVGIALGEFDDPAPLCAWLMLRMTKMTDLRDVDELLQVNYGLHLTDAQHAQISRYAGHHPFA